MQHWKHFFAPTLIAVMSLGLLASTTDAEEVVAEPVCNVADPYCHNFAKVKEYYLELGNTEESFEALVQHLRVFTDFGLTSPVNGDVYSALKPFVQSELYADWANKGTKIKLYEPTWSFMHPQWTVDRLAWAIDPKTYVNPFTWIMDII